MDSQTMALFILIITIVGILIHLTLNYISQHEILERIKNDIESIFNAELLLNSADYDIRMTIDLPDSKKFSIYDSMAEIQTFCTEFQNKYDNFEFFFDEELNELTIIFIKS